MDTVHWYQAIAYDILMIHYDKCLFYGVMMFIFLNEQPVIVKQTFQNKTWWFKKIYIYFKSPALCKKVLLFKFVLLVFWLHNKLPGFWHLIHSQLFIASVWAGPSWELKTNGVWTLGLGIVWFFFDTGAKSILLKQYQCLNGQPILIYKKIIIIIGLAISTKHMGPISQTGLRLNQN